jgi:50S ribosomal subunit-associated GTPase HflX
MKEDEPAIGVVGPCAAGKSTLVAALRSRGYPTRHIAQEHSYVQDMWKQISDPDILVYLDVSYEISLIRTGSTWSKLIYDNQVQRLQHAKEHADLLIMTDDLSPQQVLDRVLGHLQGLVTG